MTARPSEKAAAPADRFEPWPVRGREVGMLAIAYAVLTAVGLGVGFLIVGPLANTGLGSMDVEVARWWAGLRSPDWNGPSDTGSALANTFNIIGAVVLLVVIMTLVWKRWKESLTLGFALVLEALVFLTVSLTVGRERPPVEQLDTSPATASFPSGHTGAAFAFYLGLALIVWWRSGNIAVRTLAVVVGFLAAATVAVSRMYRGMHYLTDVVIGAVLGTVCLAIAAYIVQQGIQRARRSESS